MPKFSPNMHPDSFPLGQYEAAQKTLSRDPEDRKAQHRAVLSLARLGATRFALSEYERYGLNKVQDNEDIIALKGRLLKDLYILSEEDVARTYAQQSADQYDLAFQRTGGFYSAINAATMGFLGGMNQRLVHDRSRNILETLPAPDDSNTTQYYFVEATRAEAYYLLNDDIRAERALRRAFAFDPLNYTAHAATLKQFALITNHRRHSADWLESFNAPAVLHFAGHIWRVDDMLDEESLKARISDAIQRQDIGFAYGALAAGADIIMAETCLNEGVALHIVLPMDEDSFEAQCVAPFGEGWVDRYRHCLAQAVTTHSYSTFQTGPSQDQNYLLMSDICMGQTILRARDFERSPRQFLIMDELRGMSQTAMAGENWNKTGFGQTLFSVDLITKPSNPLIKTTEIEIQVSSNKEKWTIQSPQNEILKTIKSLVQHQSTADLILELTNQTSEPPDISIAGNLFLSAPLAALLALELAPKDMLEYAGMTSEAGAAPPQHWYSLKLESL